MTDGRTTDAQAGGRAAAKGAQGGAKRGLTAAQRAKRTATVHRWARFAVQAVFFVLAPGLFSGAFNGVKYLFAQVGATAPIEATSFVVLLAASLAFTVVFGRFFCGYACAFGSLGDWLYAAFEFLRSKTPIPRIVFPAPLVKALSLVKYAVLAGICVACFLGAWGSVSGMSPWVAFAGFTSGSLGDIQPAAFALLGAVVVGMIVRERFFCQFLCPMGAVFSLMPVLGFSEFTRTRAFCAKSCGKCHESCPVDIWPDADEIGHGECVSCGRCADACPMRNVNLVSIERAAAKRARLECEAASGPRPLRKTGDAFVMLRGIGVPVVLAKAALLLVVCWMTGAARYLPPLPWS